MKKHVYTFPATAQINFVWLIDPLKKGGFTEVASQSLIKTQWTKEISEIRNSLSSNCIYVLYNIFLTFLCSPYNRLQWFLRE